MKVPSGRTFIVRDRALLQAMAKSGFITYSGEPFTLKSGIKSHVYVHGRADLTDNVALEWLVGRKIAQLVSAGTFPEDNQACLIGLPTAGTPLAQAAAMVAYQENICSNGQTMIHRIMKEKPKNYGANKGWFNGSPSEHQTYWRIDNVATDGGTKIEMEQRFQADGYPSVFDAPSKCPVLIWIDRQQGAKARLIHTGFTRIHIAYNLLDIVYAYGEWGLWDKGAVAAVEQEIQQHKLLSREQANVQTI